MSDVYVDEAVKIVLECAATIKRKSQGYMILRDVRANEVGRWLQHIVEELEGACQAPGSAGEPFDGELSEQRKK
jgi:hypothetical protein